MNLPPYRPPPGEKKSPLRQFLVASLITVSVATALIFGIIHTINAHQKDRAAWREVELSRKQIDADLRKNFDPKTGITTNVDLTQIDKLRDSLKSMSRNSTGDEAVFADALSKFTDRMQAATRNYRAAVTKLREARVLQGFDSSDKSQLAARREYVHQFLDANAAMEQVITNCEDQIRADLIAAHVRPSKADAMLANYHAGTEVQNAITMKVRKCDDRVGAALLDALNTLETNWGLWKYDTNTNWIQFEDAETRETYNKYVAEIKAAMNEQLELQRKVLSQPASQP
jgi:hypothetical protein